MKILSLLRIKKSRNGRNNRGHLVSKKLGGGSKRLYILIDFWYKISDIQAVIVSFLYDPNRSSSIMLLCYKNGFLSYNLAYKTIQLYDKIFITDKKVVYSKGDNISLKNINIGCLIYNLCNEKKKKIYIRAGGTYAKIILHKINYSLILLKSGEYKLFNNNLGVNVGIVKEKKILKKTAGKNRNLGFRPIVRGVAKNPVDHPNGGSTSGGKIFCNKNGLLAKGGRTRRLKNIFIIRKRYQVLTK